MRTKLKKQLQNYSVPFGASLLFILVLVGMLALRASERSAILDLTQTNPLIAKGSSRLVSKDEALALTQNNSQGVPGTIENQGASSSNGSSGSSTATGDSATAAAGSGQETTTPAGTTATGGSSGGTTTTTTGGTTTTSGSTNTTPPPPPPTGQFGAYITALKYFPPPTDGTNNSLITSGECTKNHLFKAAVKAQNGPGVITYHWEYNFPEAGMTPPQQFHVTTGGEVNLILERNWQISKRPFEGKVRLVITGPNFSSAYVDFRHMC